MNQEQVRRTWEAVSRGDLAPLKALLAPDAKWRAVEDGPWNCENRDMILKIMAQNLTGSGLAGSVEDVKEADKRTLVAFRPARARDQWPLDDGVRYVVLTERDGMVTEMKGCANRQVALDYAGMS
jgi:ketosteroid isomerase-like protein